MPANFECSWPYFAGFFDAEGSITVPGTYIGLHLAVAQNNPFVLKELHSFLHKHGLKRWTLLSQSEGPCRLVCTDLATCKLTLQRLLDAGIDLKQKQAALALSLMADNHKQVREDMLALNGLQNKYKRLDDEGIKRAKEIRRLGQSWNRASSQERELLQVKLEGLREEHKLQNLVTKCMRLRQNIRQSLREGGAVLPL